MEIQTLIIAVLVSAFTGAIGAAVSGLLIRPRTNAEAHNMVVSADKVAADMWQEWADEMKEARDKDRETAHRDALKLMSKIDTLTRRVEQLETTLREHNLPIPPVTVGS